MLSKAKQSLFDVWTPVAIGREFHNDEKLDKYLDGWKDWINRFTDDDFDNAVKAMREDIVNEVRGHDLDRPSLAALLQYCKAAKRTREALTAKPIPEKRERTAEEKAADQKAIDKIRGMLNDD